MKTFENEPVKGLCKNIFCVIYNKPYKNEVTSSYLPSNNYHPVHAEMKSTDILLIDDDATINYLNKIIIERAQTGLQVADFTSASDALEQLASGALQPQLILLDLNMPEMDGWQFLEAYKKLSSLPKQQKVVILSSSINPADEKKAKATGRVAAFYRKPLTPDQIKEIREVVLNKG